MAATRGPRRAHPKALAVLVDADLVKRLDTEADARVVGRRFLAEALLRKGLDQLPPVADLLSQPPAAPEPEPALRDGAEGEPTS